MVKWRILIKKWDITRWQANTAGHVLAREATFIASPVIYYHIPSCINNIIIINKMQWASFPSKKNCVSLSKRKRCVFAYASELVTNKS